MIKHIISYLSNHVAHFPLTNYKYLTSCPTFYNSKSSLNGSTSLFKKQRSFLLHFLLYICFLLHLFNMLCICHRRFAIRCITLGFAFLGSETILEPTPTNVLFRQLIKTYIKQAQDQILADPRDNINRFSKPKNLGLYYGNSHIKSYYFYQHCKDYFKTAGAQGNKYILFAISFSKKSDLKLMAII